MIVSTTSSQYIPDSAITHLPEYLRTSTHVFVATHSDQYEPTLITLLQQQEFILRVYVTRAMGVYKPSTIDLLFTSPTKVELVFVNVGGAFSKTLFGKYPELLL